MPVLKDLTGMTFGRLTVIKQDLSKRGKGAVWICECSCGNTISVKSHDLLIGYTKSCGCYHRQKVSETNRKKVKILTGKRFGRLLVISRCSSVNGSATWRCKCDCGNEIIVSSHNLLHGKTNSCGCLTSAGEETTRKILLQKSIKFSTQYKFSDLKSKRGYTLKFDFALQNKNQEVLCLIEYQGQQHYICSGQFGKLQREETDQLKRDYCKEHNIPLYEIRYDENIENRIDEILADIHYFDDKPQPAASARLV